MNRFLWTIYVQPLKRIIFVIILLIVVWSFAGQRSDRKKWWKLFNAVIFTSGFVGIVFMTVYSRESGANEVILIPFQSFIEAKKQPEMYRSMLMNVFLFIPLGLSLPNVLPEKWHSWVNICLTIIFGIVLSGTIEWCQYRYGLGRCEVDDVIMNTLGITIGTLGYVIAKTIMWYKGKMNDCHHPQN